MISIGVYGAYLREFALIKPGGTLPEVQLSIFTGKCHILFIYLRVFRALNFTDLLGVWGCYFIAAITEELILLAFFMRAIITTIFNLIITIYVALFNEFFSEITAFFSGKEIM